MFLKSIFWTINIVFILHYIKLLNDIYFFFTFSWPRFETQTWVQTSGVKEGQQGSQCKKKKEPEREKGVGVGGIVCYINHS